MIKNILKILILCFAITLAFGIFTACDNGSGDTNIAFSGISFTDVQYEYDGSEKEIVITGNLPENATVSYAPSNKYSQVGVYPVVATISAANYESLTLTAIITITPKTISISDIRFTDKVFSYDGESHSILIEGNLPDSAVVNYVGNEQSKPGDYIVSAVITDDSGNYIYPQIPQATMKIIKDGKYHEVSFAYDDFSSTVVTVAVKDGETLKGEQYPDLPDKNGYEAEWIYNGLPIINDITISALYTPIDYNINYVLGNAENNARNPAKYNIESGTITLYAPIDEVGNVFQGWYTTSNYVESTRTSTIPSGTTGELTFYAKFLSYRVESADGFTFDYKNYDYPALTQTVSSTRTSIALSTTIRVSSGCRWTLSTDIEGQYEIKTKNISLAVGHNLAYITVWYADEYNLVYILDVYRLGQRTYSYAVDGVPYIDTNEVEEQTYLSAPEAPEKSGYTFKGWAVAEDSAIVSFPYRLDENTVFNAIFTPNTYTATYDVNGGDELADTDVNVVFDTYFFPIIPTRTAYDFVGWLDDEYGTTWYGVSAELAEIYKIITAPDFNADEFDIEGYNPVTLLSGIGTYIWKYPDSVKFTAQWIPTVYNIEYHLDGGVNSGDNPLTYTVEDEDITFAAPTKTGYNFVGWYKDENFNNATTGINSGSYGKVGVYAKWAFNTLTTTTNDSDAGTYTVYTEEKITAGESVTLTAATNNGYTFIGWFNGDEKLTSELTYSFKMPNGSLTYTAKWCKITLAVNDTKAGTVSSLNGKYKAGESVSVTATTNSGYTFIGWFNGDEKLTSELTYSFKMPNGSLTYTAKWCKITLAVNDENAGTVSALNDTYKAGESVSVTANTNSGYTFIGWFNGTQKLSDKLTYTFNMPTDSATYTATWACYTLTTSVSDENVGTATSHNATKITAGDSVTITATPINDEGYTWLGWYNGDEKLAGEYTYTFDMPAETVTYTAVWVCYTLTVANTEGGKAVIGNASVTVRFDLNGAAGVEPVSQVVTRENGLTYPDLPSRSGYAFAGWYDNADCEGVSYDFSEDITEDITLYAKWVQMESGYSTAYIDARNYNSSSPYSKSMSGSSSSAYIYTYFTALTTGKYYVYYKNSSSSTSYSTYLFIYNVTANSVIYANNYRANTSYSSVNFSANAGDVIYIRNYRYNTSYSPTFYFYISVANTPTDGGKIPEIPNVKNVTAGDSVKITATTNKGYNFIGWYNGDEKLTEELTYIFDMPFESVVYTAKREAIKYDIIYNLNGGENSANNPSYYTIVDSITFSDPQKTGYTFNGWYSDSGFNNQITEITIGSAEKKQVYAKWTANTYTITYLDIDSSGNYSVGEQKTQTVTYDKSVTLITPARDGYFFIDWYNGDALFRGGKWAITSDLTLTPTWEAIDYDKLSDYNYKIENNRCVITGLKNTDVTEIVIPDFVYSIASDAFRDCSNLTTVTLGENLMSIGNNAFYGCNQIEKVYNKSAINISSGNSNYGYIGYYAKAVYNSEYTSKISTDINGYVIYTDGDTKILVDYTGTETELILPSDITEINQYAFYNRSGLTSIVIPDSVISIGVGAFGGCSSLQKMTIPFVGTTKDETSNTLFGDIFGASTYSYGSSYLVPSSLKTVIITGGNIIGNSAFEYCRHLTNVIIPDSVTSIGSYAFGDCSSLTSVTIGNGVTSIGSNAFSCCRSLTSITIPESVTNIEYGAFEGCNKLVEIYNKSSLGIYTNYDYGYVGYYAKNIYTPNSGSSKLSTDEDGYILYTDGDLICLIGYLGNETELILPSDITEIYELAFYYCSSLTSITIPDSVTSIGDYAFDGCSSLNNIIADSNNPNFSSQDGILYDKGKTRIIYVPKAISGDLSLPDTLKSIDGQAFYKCNGLTNINIGNGVTIIGREAFYGCRGLTGVTIGQSVKRIKDFAFEGCSNLTSISIPDSVTSIEYEAFDYCSGLTSVYYTGTIDSWCEISFGGYNANPLCYAKNLYINNELVTEANLVSATKISAYAFRNCSSLMSITIPDSVTSIGDSAFEDCSSLTSMVIGNSVTSIGDDAFYGCSSLTSITIPESVTSIGNYAFSGCSNLTSIIIPNSVMSLGSFAFYNCSGLTNVTIGNGVISIGDCAFNSCRSLMKVTICNSIEIIGSSAYSGCSGLTSVYYKGTAADWNNITIGSYNSPLISATRYYYSETEPELNEQGTAYNGNYWHYVNGEIVIWTKEN